MKIILFLLIPLTAICQRIEFLEGAGINPKHFESIGADAGWVEVLPGPMAITGAQVFTVYIPDWAGIEYVDVMAYSKYGMFSKRITSSPGSNDQWFGINKSKGWVYMTYTVKRRSKKA